MHLPPVAHPDRSRQRDLAPWSALAVELLEHALLELREALADLGEVAVRERRVQPPRDLRGVLDVAREHPFGGEDRRVGRDEDRFRADVVTVEDRVRRAGAAVRDEDAVPRVMSLLDRRLADQVGHLRVDDPEDADRDLLRLHPELLAHLRERAQRELPVELHPAAEKRARVEIAEHEVGVGDGRVRPAEPVARRPGVRAGALRPDSQEAALVDPGDAAAPRADRVDEHLRQAQAVLGDDGIALELRLAVQDQADVERGPADVGADHVLLAVERSEVLAAEDAAGGPRVQGHDRFRRRVEHRRQPAARLHHEEGMRQSLLL